jgi:hypothetical protein
MRFRTIAAWILGGMLALVTTPFWVVLGLTLVYFKVFRRGEELAWFDWPFLLTMIAAGGLINIGTMAIVSIVHDVTGILLLPTPPVLGSMKPLASADDDHRR